MTVNDALEQNAVEVNVEGKRVKISRIEGRVTAVNNSGNELKISLDLKQTDYGINLIVFQGASPVRRGDRIRAGLIVHSAFPKEAVYLGLMHDASKNSVYERIDCKRGYAPLTKDWTKMGLPI